MKTFKTGYKFIFHLAEKPSDKDEDEHSMHIRKLETIASEPTVDEGPADESAAVADGIGKWKVLVSPH